MTHTEQEYNQLKEELNNYADWFGVTPKTVLTVKIIFDMNQQYSNHIMDLIKENRQLNEVINVGESKYNYILNENTILKQKLEKIEK